MAFVESWNLRQASSLEREWDKVWTALGLSQVVVQVVGCFRPHLKSTGHSFEPVIFCTIVPEVESFSNQMFVMKTF